MPKTAVQQITFMCLTGLGNPNASCRFHRASNNMPSDNMCPVCGKQLVRSTDSLDKITMTVMGEEDIEPEILDRDETSHRAAQLTAVAARIIRMDTDGEFPTPVRRELQRARFNALVEEEIAQRKREGFFLTTPAQIVAYRDKRKVDIVKAITAARKFEDVP